MAFDDSSPPTGRRRTRTILLTLLVLIVLILHHDWWYWNTAHPLIFGFLPVGLAYHALYSIACSILMWILVRFAWPTHLESLESHRTTSGGSH